MEKMRNAYVEYIVKRKDPSWYPVLKVLCVVLTAFGVFMALANVFGLILLAAAAVLDYFVFLYASQEYEYLYIEGSFSVDAILNKSRRKKLVDTGKEALILVAPAESDAVKSELRSGQVKELNLTGRDSRNPRFAYIYNQGQEKRCLWIEGTQELLREMRYFTPSKVKML